MKIKIIAETFVKGEVLKVSDKPIDIDDNIARELIRNYKAEPYAEPAEAQDSKKQSKKDKEV